MDSSISKYLKDEASDKVDNSAVWDVERGVGTEVDGGTDGGFGSGAVIDRDVVNDK